MHVTKILVWQIVAAIVLVFLSPTVVGRAFCDLRDPTHQIYELYPEATGYRSLVESVDSTVKDEIGAQLPFTLHNRELGKHTLYVALKEGEPLGFVHVRSEAGQWGLLEIVWSLSLDLRVNDFRFQRCREMGCDDVANGALKTLLKGHSQQELREKFGLSPQSFDPVKHGVAPADATLARSVFRSALKTLLVTELVWAEEIAAHQPGQ